jgi:hypothetical protein
VQSEAHRGCGSPPPRQPNLNVRLLALRSRRPSPWLWAVVGYAVAFVVVTWPLVARFTHATYGGPGDGWALIWQTRFRVEHGLSYFSPTHGFDAGWPVGSELTSSFLLSNASIELPHAALLTLGVGDVPAYNLIVFAAAMTSSLAMYAVLRRLGCGPAIAFWGGLVYLLAPWHLVKLSIHPTLASMAALPLLLLGIVEWARRPGWRSGALVVGAAALATYTHSYYGVAVALTLVATLPLVLIAHSRRRSLGRVLPEIALLSGALAAVPIPLAIALSIQSSEVSQHLDRHLYVIELAARPRLWLLPSIDNPIFGDLSRRYLQSRGPLNEGELALYVGLLTLTLAIVALIAALRHRSHRLPTAIAATMALIGAAFAAPALVRLPVIGETVRMPVGYLNDALGFISTPARFFALTLTGVVVLAAFGLRYLTERMSRRWGLALITCACAISAVELPSYRADLVVSTQPTPLVTAIERRVPRGEPVAEYPSIDNFYLPIARQLFYQVHHHHPLLNGAASASLEDSVRRGVEDSSDPATPSKLALLGFRFAAHDVAQAFERALIVGEPDPTTVARAYTPPKGFTVLERTQDGSVLMRVTARPAVAFVSIGTGFTRVGRWMTKQNATLLACATASGLHTLQFRVGAFAVNRRFTVGHNVISVTTGPEQAIRTDVHLRRGWQLVPIELIGSQPIRPSDVIPGEPDSRPVAISIGPISVRGPRGASSACARPTRLGDIPTADMGARAHAPSAPAALSKPTNQSGQPG